MVPVWIHATKPGRHGTQSGKDRVKVKGGARTIGLVLLLFVCSGAVTWHLATENEPEHKGLRTNALCAVSDTGRSPAPPVSLSRTHTGDGVAASSICPSFSRSPAFRGTLLSLGSLLCV